MLSHHRQNKESSPFKKYIEKLRNKLQEALSTSSNQTVQYFSVLQALIYTRIKC